MVINPPSIKSEIIVLVNVSISASKPT
jgi:hypothetical protein